MKATTLLAIATAANNVRRKVRNALNIVFAYLDDALEVLGFNLRDAINTAVEELVAVARKELDAVTQEGNVENARLVCEAEDLRAKFTYEHAVIVEKMRQCNSQEAQADRASRCIPIHNKISELQARRV